MNSAVSFIPLASLPEILPGMSLATQIGEAVRASALVLHPYDVLIVAQKIVSKAEGRTVDLQQVRPSERALELAKLTGKDPRLVELALAESAEIVRAAPNVLIARHRLGYVMANAGIDRSNVPSPEGKELVLLLPVDPDISAARLQEELMREFDVPLGVIVSDSFGRPWRNGVVNVALGAAGLPAIVDRRGEADRQGRRLEVTEVAIADALAAGAALVMGEGAEGVPVALARGLRWSAPNRNAAALLRPKTQDLFR